jgi:hypothetical protein
MAKKKLKIIKVTVNVLARRTNIVTGSQELVTIAVNEGQACCPSL